MAQPSGGKPGPDFLVEAARAHASAAKVWEALAERERLAAAANQALAEQGVVANLALAEGARAMAKVALPPPARLVKAAAPGPVPPLPLGAPPPLAVGDSPLEPLAPGAVRKASLAPRAKPKAPVQMPGIAAPKKVGRKSSHVRTRAPSEYEYETSVYYTSESEAPKELAVAKKKAQGQALAGPPAKPRPAVRGSQPRKELEEAVAPGRRLEPQHEPQQGPKKARVRRTQLRRSSPHRRRKKTHLKARVSPEQPRSRSRGRSVSKSCGGPDERRRGGERARSSGLHRASPRHQPPAQLVQKGRGRSRKQDCERSRGDRASSRVAGRLREQERAPERPESEGARSWRSSCSDRRLWKLDEVGTAERATAPYRCSPQRKISFEEYRRYPGVRGRPEERRSRSPSTRCVPRRRAPVLVQRRRSRSRGGTRRGPGPEEEPVTVIMLPKFNSRWQEFTLLRRGLDGDGIGLRKSMDLGDMHPSLCVYWGRKFRGRQCAEGWIELGLGGYIPMDVGGVRVVVAGKLRSLGRGEVVQPAGAAAEQWPPPLPPLPPPAEEPAAEEEAAVPHKTLEEFFCQWDDAHFKDRVPALLPDGWQQLTSRQLKRQVSKWRKAQCVWRFVERGDFRDYILARMPQKEFEELHVEQKERHWQAFKADCPRPDGAGGPVTPPLRPQPERGAEHRRRERRPAQEDCRA